MRFASARPFTKPVNATLKKASLNTLCIKTLIFHPSMHSMVTNSTMNSSDITIFSIIKIHKYHLCHTEMIKSLSIFKEMD